MTGQRGWGDGAVRLNPRQPGCNVVVASRLAGAQTNDSALDSPAGVQRRFDPSSRHTCRGSPIGRGSPLHDVSDSRSRLSIAIIARSSGTGFDGRGSGFESRQRLDSCAPTQLQLNSNHGVVVQRQNAAIPHDDRDLKRRWRVQTMAWHTANMATGQ
jgi:hypothetical protein